MIATTIISSIRVKPFCIFFIWFSSMVDETVLPECGARLAGLARTGFTLLFQQDVCLTA